jgi:hypothetical protein
MLKGGSLGATTAHRTASLDESSVSGRGRPECRLLSNFGTMIEVGPDRLLDADVPVPTRL